MRKPKTRTDANTSATIIPIREPEVKVPTQSAVLGAKRALPSLFVELVIPNAWI